MRVLVSGSRVYSDKECVARAIEKAVGSTISATIVHGGAAGADTIAGELADEYGFTKEVYPADWDSFGSSAGGIRNKEMMITLPDIALFFFQIGESNAGTRDAAKLAIKFGIPSRYHMDGREVSLQEVKNMLPVRF